MSVPVDEIVQAITIALYHEHINAGDKRPRRIVRVNGVVTPVTDLTVRHGRTQPVGTCTMTLDAPLPAHVMQGAEVTVQLGYDASAGSIVPSMQTVFRGSIPQREQAISDRGATATVTAASRDGSRLARKDYADIRYTGPITLKQLFAAVCRRRGVSSNFADETTYPDGTTPITFATNADANQNTVTVPRKTTSLDFLREIADLFGYAVFDTPAGLRLRRMLGVPDGLARLIVVEGVNPMEVTSRDDIARIVNYWEIFGADYTAPAGNRVPIRSIASEIPFNPLIQPDGWRRDERRHTMLDTYALADAVRNVQEITWAAPRTEIRWRTHGAPHILPGDVAQVTSETAGALTGRYWIDEVQHTFSDQGFYTDCTGWRGEGSAYPAGNDCVTTAIPGGPWHIGDEYISWYAHPHPMGYVVKIPFTVTEGYSSLTVRALAHGTNSYLLSGQNAESDVSRFEIWQFGERVGSGNLPVLNEDYNRRLPYGAGDTYWSPIVVPVSGALEAGAAELWIVSGKDTRASGGPTDDMEIKAPSLVTCGVGSPVIGEEL